MGYFAYGPEILGTEARIYEVSQDPRAFQTIQEAIDAAAADGLAVDNRAQILIKPGVYTSTAVITVPGFLSIVGADAASVRLQNDTTDLFQVTGANTFFYNFTIQGGTNLATRAFDLNNQDVVTIRDVSMTDNGGTARQGFLSQSGTSWQLLFLERVKVDFGGLTGFHTFLTNTGAAARSCRVMADGCSFTADALTSSGGQIQVNGCQDVRIRNSIFVGNSFTTHVDLNVAGVTGTPNAELNHCWLEAEGVPFNTEAGTRISVYDCFYERAAATFLGDLTEDATVDQVGVGTWRDVGASANPGDMNPDNAVIGSTTSIVLFHDNLAGQRVRNLLDSIRPGDSVMFVPLTGSRPGATLGGTFTVGGSSQTATTVTLSGLTFTNGAGNWADAGRWGLVIVPTGGGSGDVVGPASATDNGIALYNGTTGKLIDSPSDLTYVSGALFLDNATAAVRLQERANPPGVAAGKGLFWVKNDTPNLPAFSADTGDDYRLGVETIRLHGKLQGNGTQNQWYTWNNFGWAQDSTWDTPYSLGTGTTPDLSAGGTAGAWMSPGIHFLGTGAGARLLSVTLSYNHPEATAADIAVNLRGITVADLDTAPTTESSHATGTITAAAALKQRIFTLTINDSTIANEEKLYFCARRTSVTAITDPQIEIIIRVAYRY